MSTNQSNHWLHDLVQDFQRQENEIKLGGGASKIERHHAKGKLTARERVERLIDKDTEFFELGLWAGYEMYEEENGCPAGGVITGTGMIAGRKCMIVANDATVKAGAWFPITAKKKICGLRKLLLKLTYR